ncbi:MAG TPA: molybdopterin cofactor-binding domain-containing protein, partial [Casimicrobiaceae bacterium]|nr:molybdopterin cofactor-binding domain-containing protein [Casimicrobiaceae bacterium]
RWVRFDPERTVTVWSGKVEIGQGIRTAIAQIAADELDVAVGCVTVVDGDTTRSPDEGYTSGSQSIEIGGMSMRQACAEVRALFLEEAARAFEVSTSELRVRDGRIHLAGTDLATSYWELAPRVDLARDATGAAAPKPAAERVVAGASVRRRDLPAKLTGGAYVHDMTLPGMVFGRVLRPPSRDATLGAFDAEGVRTLPGVVAVVVNGSFVGICAEREEQAVAALQAARAASSWRERASMPSSTELRDFLCALPAERTVVSRKGEPPTSAAAKRIAASYSKPYLAHASIGPSCALARLEQGRYTIWSHTQGSHHLRNQVARALGVAAADVDVIHADGAGCYGHNGADDVALDAALLARACGRPVLVQWTREDELAASPCGTGMVVNIAASLDADGLVAGWQHEVWSHTHSSRPGSGEGVDLLAAWHLDPPLAPSKPRDVPLPRGGAARNSIPLYDFPSHEIAFNLVADSPLRVSALRSLGAYANVFAIESFIDELAAAADEDPIAFRLRHLGEPRARAVVEAVAKAAKWTPGEKGDGTRGRGIGFGRYKGVSAWCAVIAEVAVGAKVEVRRVIAAVDAGEVINPDALANQVEGGIIQAISWTLKEQVLWDATRVTTRSWETYPILRLDEVPEIEVTVIDRPETPPLGVGECAAGPTAAALANALFGAMGVRVRDLPLTPERIARAME